MNQVLVVRRTFHVDRQRRGRKKLHPGPAEAPVGRIPRVTRLMALAIRFDQLLREGLIGNQADLARLGDVSRARLTQIMNLVLLAPDIQEQLLSLPQPASGLRPIRLQQLQPIAAVSNWRTQRRMWAVLVSRAPRG
jgi:hypothetical protein